MNFPVILACFAFISSAAASTAEGGVFCYLGDECGPTSKAWAPLCHSGSRQSPINLPPILPITGYPSINLDIYRGDSFRMQNNGHALSFDFDNKGPSTTPTPFPDPMNPSGPTKLYKFASGHFHWGVNDLAQGSEHCIGIVCGAMELHLVHYLASYGSQAAAVASGDESALTVLGVIIDLNVGKSLIGALGNMLTGQSAKAGTGNIKPIVDNLAKVEHANHDATQFTTINQPLNLREFLSEPFPELYSYKGSLTTPGCNEQVNWWVMKKPSSTSHQDLQAFRSVLKDSSGATLNQNHRPTQPLKNRVVRLSKNLRM